MIAVHDIKAEMREACAAISSVQPDAAPGELRIDRSKAPEHCETNIEPWMEDAFHTLTHASELGADFALVSCFVNGQPAAVIAATRREGRDIHVLPLFLAVQPDMTFTRRPTTGAETDAA